MWTDFLQSLHSRELPGPTWATPGARERELAWRDCVAFALRTWLSRLRGARRALGRPWGCGLLRADLHSRVSAPNFKGASLCLRSLCVSFPSLEKTRPRAFSLSRQMTQTRCLSAGAHVVGSEQPPSQYLADVDTSDEDSLRGLRAARRPSEQRGRPRSERQVR